MDLHILSVLFGSVILQVVAHNDPIIAFSIGVPKISMGYLLLSEIPMIYMDCQQLLREVCHTRQFATYLAQLVKAVISCICILPSSCLI